MTHKELKKLRYLPKELVYLKEEVQRLSNKVNSYIISDGVSASSEVIPYAKHSITLQGINDIQGYLYAKAKRDKKEREYVHCFDEIKRLEEYIDAIEDEQVRRIFIMFFKEGKTSVETSIALEIESDDTVRKKIQRHLQK